MGLEMEERACPTCGASFADDYDLIYHIERVHSPPAREKITARN